MNTRWSNYHTGQGYRIWSQGRSTGKEDDHKYLSHFLMSRPETQGPPEMYYGEKEANKYSQKQDFLKIIIPI